MSNLKHTGDQVYFICAPELPDRVKIGVSHETSNRLRELQIGSPARLVVMAVASGDSEDEANLHRIFQRDRMHGEWFRLSPELAELIRGVIRGVELDVLAVDAEADLGICTLCGDEDAQDCGCFCDDCGEAEPFCECLAENEDVETEAKVTA